MLHIVNGDHVGNSLRSGGIAGDVLVWRELYTEGPVFADPRREIRTDYMVDALGVPRDEWKAALDEQTNAFEHAAEREEIVLWFEHDLFDQTMLVRLLHEFERQPLGRTRLSLVCVGEYPGFEPFHRTESISGSEASTFAALAKYGAGTKRRRSWNADDRLALPPFAHPCTARTSAQSP
ncbi:DUF1835 domain-containing protein [Cohnella cellulosilytica]|uniref:DUF1835 domain-containing protein n=1 Tax=Cohnella cellulosilytica TaxID=986710 RepID=A0ABW2FDJ5_9BACL